LQCIREHELAGDRGIDQRTPAEHSADGGGVGAGPVDVDIQRNGFPAGRERLVEVDQRNVVLVGHVVVPAVVLQRKQAVS